MNPFGLKSIRISRITGAWGRTAEPLRLPDGSLGIYVGRPSPLGNPYRLPNMKRLDPQQQARARRAVCEQYREELEGWLLSAPNPASRMFERILGYMAQGEQVTLLCFCCELDNPFHEPLTCHAQVIGQRLLEAYFRSHEVS